MTLKKVAELAGVSRTTVSLVINQVQGSRVSERTKQRVLAAIRQLDYKPNLIAQRLSLRKTDAIGLFIPFSSPLFSNSTNVEIIGGVQEVANEKGVDLVLFPSGKNCLEPGHRTIDNVLTQNAVDGIIVCNTRFSTRSFIDKVTRLMKEKKLRAVLMEYYWGKADIQYVGADYDGGIYQAIRRLVDLGHRTIGLITPPPAALITERMVASYRRAHEHRKLPFRHELVANADYTVQMTQTQTRRLVSGNPELSAIFVGDYEMALSCVKAIKGSGLSVPGDVSVISFADHDVFPFLEPSLTAVSIPYYEMGKRAAELLFDDGTEKKRIILPTALVVRESTAPLNARAAKTAFH